MPATPRLAARRRRTAVAGLAVALLSASLLTGCDTGSLGGGDGDAQSGGAASGQDGSTGGSDGGASSDGPEVGSEADEPESPATLTPSIDKGSTDVPVDTSLALQADEATLTSVVVHGSGDAGDLEGTLAADGASWASTGRLQPGATYVVKADMRDVDGNDVVRRTGFTTQDLTLDQQTYPSLAPLGDETVGVGMPVIVTFDVPVTDRASFEKHMSVQTTPEQPGTWHWMSDTEAHYRPQNYWQPGTQVHVDVDVDSVPAGGGIYGQESRALDFTVGDAHVYKVNAQTHQMKVFSNGELLRKIPITTGKEGFTTRSGTKVIIEKFDSKRMNSETVGIPAGSSDAYDIDNVQWAMRLTYSGEFIHAAPWSVGSQGRANVSHGCTGMSTSNADWLFHLSRRGDVVEYTGTDKPMTLDNGYGDWNQPFVDYQEGSAL